MEKIQNLLSQVKIINDKNNEILDATGARFNIFKVCGVNHYENTHSAILAEFLNPNGSHGLKHQFLQTFIEILDKDFTLESFNVEKANVKTEYSTSEGRIDIFIEDDNNVIIIENKIYAGDQKEQLKRYDNFAKNYTKNYQIFYLTLFGNEASEQSGEGVDYTPISYTKTIIEWLEKCLHISTRYPMVRETIAQYINHLKTLTHQDMDTKNQQEIAQILANDLETAQAIYQNFWNAFRVIVEKDFNSEMKKFAKTENLKYEYLDLGSTSKEYTAIQFKLTKDEWKDFHIEFGYDKDSGYYYGLKEVEKSKTSEERRKEIQIKLEILGVYNTKIDSYWWVFWTEIPTLTIENWQNLSPFVDDCKTKIKEILKAMEGIDF